ncbi:nickel-dependent hydrogenase large subunit [Sulfurimonas sp.]|jgi:Ni,Fe-hydrogenase I large subunit|uniref:nickel-dependent hydrogenase large subunit n=1 Tax=Sulfurimonas sp. TaxID=2022749 RepID=UPI0025DA5C2D|nr:nickel-dependent hydrogenase large subunit [Sulfurimonas sp.]MCK9473282.1 nickel-dependent hydrogenase large subunit [Sulfurimonas sp.]
MSERKITIDPLTRIEGHLKFETIIKDGVVTDAKCSAEMYRGIEKALIGYDARVAQQVTQRVCGVCPYAHAEAASLALENAMGIKPNHNGQLLRNMIVGAYQLQDHLLHFYILSALDFIDITAVLKYEGDDDSVLSVKKWVQNELKSNKIFPAAPFLPRYEAMYAKGNNTNFTAIKNYLEAIKVMADLTKAVAIFGAKAPHPVTLEAGGVTTIPTIGKLAKYRSLIISARNFIKDNYLNDIIAVAKEFPEYFKIGAGYGDYLSYPYLPDENGENHLFVGGSTIDGKYEELDLKNIFEDHKYSYYKSKPDSNVRPLDSTDLTPINYEEFKEEQKKEGGKYSWSRAPRYKGKIMEVGPVARVINTYKSGKNKKLNTLVDSINKKLGLTFKEYNSVLGRHLCRAIMATTIIDKILEDTEKVIPDELAFVERAVPKNAVGFGLTEATRGALAHWIETDENGLIKNYDMIVPTTWNISPKDASGALGAVEKMLMGTKIKDPDNPIELARIVRSTDPCLACSVH